jgi:hypothetical protein
MRLAEKLDWKGLSGDCLSQAITASFASQLMDTDALQK